MFDCITTAEISGLLVLNVANSHLRLTGVAAIHYTTLGICLHWGSGVARGY